MKKIFKNYKKVAQCLFLTLAILTVVNTLLPNKASADSTYPDSNGNGVPDWVENQLKGACSTSGNHTYHLVWFHPATLNPPYGATSDSTSLKSVAYICPGVGYSYSSNITHTITTHDSRLTFPSGKVFNMGTAYRGGFSSVATLPVNISLTGISYDNWNYFNINYWGYAYPGGKYDCFMDPGCTPTSANIGIYIVRPPTPVNSGYCTVSISPSTVTAGQQFTATFTVANTSNYYTWSVDPLLANSNKYTLRSINAGSNSWAGVVLNIPGYDTGPNGYGLVLYPNNPTPVPNGFSTPTTFKRTYTAPSATTQFTWEIFEQSGHPNISTPTCTKTLTVTAPQPTFECVDLETTNGSISLIRNDGDTFGIKVGMTFTGLTPTPSAYRLNISSPTLSYSQNGVSYTVSGSTLTYTPTQNFTPAPGKYIVNWSITNSTGSTTYRSCSGEIIVVKKPYVRIYGGDAIAGAGFVESDGSCEKNSSANLRAYDTMSPNFAGSGTQIANHALNLIQGLPSGMARGSGSGKSLAFSNIGGLFGLWSAWGGSWGSQYMECIPDYWNTGRPANPTVGSTFSTATAVSGSYLSTNSSVTINGGGADNSISGKRITLYVQGDVYIANNTQYNGFAIYNRPEDIPNFTVIATGNIYINNQVSAISGKYVAQNGSIYTCTFGVNVQPTDTQLNTAGAGGCQNKLIVWGSLIANSIKFQRSSGSLKDALANEARNDNSIAEVIQYGPEIWLGNTTTVPSRYDSITSLPPVL